MRPSRPTTGQEARPRLAVAGEPGGLPQGSYTSTKEQIDARYRQLVAAGRVSGGGLFGVAHRRRTGATR